MTEAEPCFGPLCPLMALYGAQSGRELFEWLQERTAGFSVPPPEFGAALSERDYFLILPVQSRTVILDRTVPDRGTPFTGLQLQVTDAAHPLQLDWQTVAMLGKRASLMITFPLQNYTPSEYRQMVEDLLVAAQNGVRWLRLDTSRAPSWPEGGEFLSRLEAHGFVQLVRRTLDLVAPHIRLAAGENAPQAQNFAFFGSGGEADLVENLALAPLLLHALETEQAAALVAWASGLKLPYPGLTFYNTLRFTGRDSFRCVEGLLPPDEVERMLAHRTRGSGFLSALAGLPGSERFDLLQERLRAAQAILLALTGLPGFELSHLPGGRLLRARTSWGAFHPYGAQLTLPVENPAVFSLLRIAPDGRSLALCLQNVSAGLQEARPDLKTLGLQTGAWHDLISGEKAEFTQRPRIRLKSFQAVWFVPEEDPSKNLSLEVDA
ncbi:MAG: hypothetical protein HPY59_00125 [Anaerolineae bacterium]|nr:hypothetical protein [Anaerolineae bacterium]